MKPLTPNGAPSEAASTEDEDGPLVERLDRYILVVRVRQPFVDWVSSLEELNGVEEGELRFNLEEANAIPSTYLVPYSFDPEPVIAWVMDNCGTIFEGELSLISTDADLWPQDRSADVFEAWFDLEILDAPIDLVDGPVYLSELSEEELAERYELTPRQADGSV